jgi:hypothetical protein
MSTRFIQKCAEGEVRYDHMIYDCSDAHPVRETRATPAAVQQAIHVLRVALGTD